jgi:hypothetical protein
MFHYINTIVKNDIVTFCFFGGAVMPLFQPIFCHSRGMTAKLEDNRKKTKHDNEYDKT